MDQTRTASSRVPVVILAGVSDHQNILQAEQIFEGLKGGRIAIIEHASGDRVRSEARLAGNGQYVQWLTAHCTCRSMKGDAIDVLHRLVQPGLDGASPFDGMVVDTATPDDASMLVRVLSEQGPLNTHYYVDTVLTAENVGSPCPESASGELNQHSMSADAMRTMSGALEWEQTQLLMSRLRVSTSSAGNENATEDWAAESVADSAAAAIGGSETSLDINAVGDKDEPKNGIGSFVFRSSQPFEFGRLGNFVADVLKVHGDNLLHYKGILYFAGCANRVFFEGKGIKMHSAAGPEWGMTEGKESTMIFVGRNLPREVLATGLEQCLVDAKQAWR